MKVVRINAGEFGSNCWLVIDEVSAEAVVIDPSPEIDRIKSALADREVNLEYIFLTHGHFDHMTSCDTLRDFSDAPLCVHREDAVCLVNSEYNAYRKFMADDLTFRPADILIEEGDTFKFGSLEVSLIHTPGHTKGSVCYFIGDCMFTGDTLFDGGVGRCDLPGGSMESLIESLKKIKSIGRDYKIFTGHGSNTTLEKQKAFNVYLKNI